MVLNLSQEFSSQRDSNLQVWPSHNTLLDFKPDLSQPLGLLQFCCLCSQKESWFLGDTPQRPIFEWFQMELSKLLSWQQGGFSHFLCFRGGNRHRKWRWNHLNLAWISDVDISSVKMRVELKISTSGDPQIAVCVIFSVWPTVEICWIRWMVFCWCWTSNSAPLWTYFQKFSQTKNNSPNRDMHYQA